MELEEFVARQIQSLQSLEIAEGLKDNSWAAHLWHRGEEVAGDVQIFEILKLEHVIRELLKIIGGQVQLFQVYALVEVSDGISSDLIIGEVKTFKSSEVVLAKRRDLGNLVELQVEILKELEVAELLHTDLIVCEVERCQVLEIAQILFDNVHDLF